MLTKEGDHGRSIRRPVPMRRSRIPRHRPIPRSVRVPLLRMSATIFKCIRHGALGQALSRRAHVGPFAILGARHLEWPTDALPVLPVCGSRIFHQLSSQKEIISIKPGTLNNTKWLKPVGHIWSQSAQPWVEWGKECLMYPQNPSSFEAMSEAWKVKRRQGA